VQILVLNGVNLDVLGRRDHALYGGLSIDELETRIYHWANESGHTARCRQTNSEGEYIDWIHDAIDWQGGMIVNAAAWTHYSYAIRDALEILTCPWVEVHLSNVDEREDWRRVSVIEGLASHRIIGKGPQGYKEAIEWLSANAKG
jgi:3-dehydroquinate dehydratase-2